VEHQVCLSKPDKLVEHLIDRRVLDERDSHTKLKIAKIELEQAKILLKIEELKSTRNTAQSSLLVNNINNINNVNTNTVIINYVTIGNENLEPLSREVLQTMSIKPKESFTNLGIEQLYFNKHFPENQIIQAPNPASKNVKLYNGVTWLPTPKEEAAQIILSGLVESVKRTFKLLPRDDKEIDQMFNKIYHFIYDQIEDSSISPKLILEVEKNMFKLYTKLHAN